jgi:hypothetical protein
VGKATFTEEIENGPIKDVRVVTIRADFSKDLSADNSVFLHIHKLALVYPVGAKVGGLQSPGVKGEIVVGYLDPLTTQDLKSSGFPAE